LFLAVLTQKQIEILIAAVLSDCCQQKLAKKFCAMTEVFLTTGNGLAWCFARLEKILCYKCVRFTCHRFLSARCE